MFFCWLDYTVTMVLLQSISWLTSWCVTLGSGLSMLEFELQVFCKADFASLLAVEGNCLAVSTVT